VKYQFLNPWHRFLPHDGGHVISLFGGGGKTSLMLSMASVYLELNVPIVASTTTRTEPLNQFDPTVWQTDGPHKTAAPVIAAEVPMTFVHGGEHANGKWLGLKPDEIEKLGAANPERILLIEADGSAGMPVKLHRHDEPIWPSQTSLAVAVMGLSAIGRPIADVLHRYGQEPAAWLGPVAEGESWSWDCMFRLLAGPRGYTSRLPSGVPSVLALTQMERLEDSVGLFDFVERVMSEAGLPIVMFCELGEAAYRIRVACRSDSEEE
jgi:probable selenium-dependent hydroxylase accessory protein YqeC